MHRRVSEADSKHSLGRRKSQSWRPLTMLWSGHSSSKRRRPERRKGSLLGTARRTPAKARSTYTNDGRPPDTTNKLLTPEKLSPKPTKMPEGVNWNTFGILWNFTFNDREFRATNTCSMDTTLMTWYLLHRANLPRGRIYACWNCSRERVAGDWSGELRLRLMALVYASRWHRGNRKT